MKLDDLYKGKFFSRLIDDSGTFIKEERLNESFKKAFSRKIQESKWSSLSARHKFHLSAFYASTEIAEKIQALEHCLVFINSFPKTKLWSKNFSRADYIRYHLEVYYGNIVGIFDRCLILVSHLYDLGFKVQDVKYNLLINNKHLEGEKVLKILKEFHKALEKIRTVRNYIQHQGSLADKDLDEMRMYEFVLKEGHLKGKFVRQLKGYLKISYGFFLRKKKREIKTNNTAVISIVVRLFESLEERYKNRMEDLSSKKPSKVST